jgi:hypothetical protein
MQATVEALKTVTVGDLLYVGKGYRTRIRERTFSGVDVNGTPFAAYSTKGPFYLYVNRDATTSRAARATASKSRHRATGLIGFRTPTGIRYESYAAAKSAHGAGVNLYGMEQHPHMLDLMIVRAGGAETTAADDFDFGSELEAFESSQECTALALGFYGDEAERARGNNEGTATIPQRNFFALNADDLSWGEQAIAQRMLIRARGRA